MIKHIENIVIGTPIVPLWTLLGKDDKDTSFLETTVFDTDRYLPRLLAKYGFSKSASEIKRNRKDLIIELNDLDFFDIKLGKKRVTIIVGLEQEIVDLGSKLNISDDYIEELSLNTSEIDNLKDIIVQSIKPTVFINTTNIEDLEESELPQLWNSKFGGNPYLVKGDSYPLDESGNPMLLFMQVNFKETPQIPNFPTDGILQIFMCNDDSYSYSVNDEKYYTCKQDYWKIIYIPKVLMDNEKLETTFPIDFKDYLYSGALPLYSELKMEFEKSYAVLPFDSYELESLLEIHGLSRLVGEEILYKLIDTIDSSNQNIGGYNNFVQIDPREGNKELRFYNTSLFKIDSSKNMMWGDNGIGNFMISLEDLKQRNFKNVLYTWDCC